MIKELLAKLGIGAASVDLRVPTTDVEQGERLDVEVTAEGGWVDQEVNRVDYAVRTEYRVETDEGESRRTFTLAEGTLDDGFTLGAGETRTVDGSVEVPANTPTTDGREPVWIDTALDVDWANDPDDTDHLEVRPGERLAATLEALDSLGFELGSVENGQSGSSLHQEFEFRARAGPYAGDLDELEVVPRYRDDRVEFAVEVDQSGGMLSEMTGADESRTTVTVTEPDPDAIAEEFRATIDEHA